MSYNRDQSIRTYRSLEMRERQLVLVKKSVAYSTKSTHYFIESLDSLFMINYEFRIYTICSQKNVEDILKTYREETASAFFRHDNGVFLFVQFEIKHAFKDS